MSLDAPLVALSGVGPARSAALARLGLERLRDLLLFAPRRVESSGALFECAAARAAVGEVVIVRGRIGARSFQRFGGRSTLRFEVTDESGALEVCYYNQPWMRARVVAGTQGAFAGRVLETRRGPALISPRWVAEEEASSAERWLPVYPTTEGLGQDFLRSLCRRASEEHAALFEEALATAELARLGLPALAEAVRALHAPSSEEHFLAARRRVMFEELVRLQARVLARARKRSGAALEVRIGADVERELRAHFPFELTAGQRSICADLRRDLARRVPMRRLLQGDVGSGKTVLGLYACLAVARAGAQSAFLAPTELLAEQHAEGARSLLERVGLRSAILTGSLPARERRRLLDELELGRIDVVFGTHALFSTDVRYRRLALAVIDEQHRFGVAQRARLLEKGRDVHLFLMTATPIPRTLALTVYGDLDVSILRERPPGRGPLRTRWLRAGDRARVLPFLVERLEAGEQVYWVAPRIGAEEADESEREGSAGALRACERLQRSSLAPHGVELVHGRMEPGERSRRLERFRNGAARVLVATTLIEVGVDVPRATVMVIEEAERLGLAQLHQLRGRVGRSERESWCLLYGRRAAEERLRLLERTGDGFEIAEEDLRRRGMGELLGLRQSGASALELEGELELLLAARDLLRDDRALHRRLLQAEPDRAPLHIP